MKFEFEKPGLVEFKQLSEGDAFSHHDTWKIKTDRLVTDSGATNCVSLFHGNHDNLSEDELVKPLYGKFKYIPL